MPRANGRSKFGPSSSGNVVRANIQSSGTDATEESLQLNLSPEAHATVDADILTKVAA